MTYFCISNAVSDVVVTGDIPTEIRRNEMWVGCVAGALEENEYRNKLESTGFSNITLEPTRRYYVADFRDFAISKGIDVDAIAPLVDGKFISAFVRASKPLAN